MHKFEIKWFLIDPSGFSKILLPYCVYCNLNIFDILKKLQEILPNESDSILKRCMYHQNDVSFLLLDSKWISKYINCLSEEEKVIKNIIE